MPMGRTLLGWPCGTASCNWRRTRRRNTANRRASGTDLQRVAKRGRGTGMNKLTRIGSVSVLAMTAALLGGCAGPMTAQQAAASGMPQYCSVNNAATGALVGSAMGALIGGALGGWQGAAIGAGSGLALGGLTGAQADAQ